MHRLKARDALASVLQVGVGGRVRRDHDLRGLVLYRSILLDEARDAHAFLGEDLADRGQHAGSVVHANAVVGTRHHLPHRDHTDAVVEREGRPALDAAADGPRQVDQVADDRRRGGPASRALPDQQHLAHEVALDEDGVVGALDLGERMVERHHRRVHARFHASRVALRMGDELDCIPELSRVTEVDWVDPFDALSIDVVRVDRDLVRDRAEDGELVRGVEAADIVGGVRLRVAGRLRLTHGVLERQLLIRHPAEDVVGRAVDHGRHALDPVGLQVGPEGADQRDAAADRGLEVDVDVLLGGQAQQLRAVVGHHDLVGRHHVLAGPDRPLEIRMHRLVAARHLDEDLDRRIVEEHVGLVREQIAVDLHGARLSQVANEHSPQAQLDASAAGQLGMPGEHALGHPRADRAQPDQADVQGPRCHRALFSTAVARILREEDVAEVLDMDAVIAAVTAAMRELGEGKAQNEPRRRAFAPGALLNVMFAAYPGGACMGLKAYSVSGGKARFLVTVFGLDGTLSALIDADLLGAYRTGAATAVAARAMGPKGPVAVALSRVLEISELRIFSRDQGHREAFASEQATALGLKVVAAPSAEAAVRGAGVVVTITTSTDPVLDAAWVTGPALVVGAGSNFANRSEIPADLVERAQTIVVDQLATARLESGDLIAAHAAGKFEWERAVELGSVLAGGWKPPEPPGVTLFESHGLALWDLAAASTVLPAAEAKGLGQVVEVFG